jgi:hypothetical protein
MHYIASMVVRGLLVAGLVAAASAQAEVARLPRAATGERELVIVNHSDRVMNEIYVSPSSTDAWGADRLGDATLENGRSIRLRLGRMRECSFDVQVIYDDASREQQLGHDACLDRQVVFTGAGAQLPPSVLGAQHQVTLLNLSPRAIQQIFISPAEASQWGDDLLPNRSISVGDSVEVTYHGACAADLRVVFENRAAEERRGLDLCETPAITIRPGWTTADTVPGPAAQHIQITNHSGHALVGFYLRPEHGDAPGHDLLGGAGLANGKSIQLLFGPAGACRFTAHAVFAGTTLPRDVAGLDLCADPAITLLP